MFEVKLENGSYCVTGEGVNVTVDYRGMYSRNNKVSGKGSRTYKAEIIEAVQRFIVDDARNTDQSWKDKSAQFKQGLSVDNVDLFGLYRCEVYNQGYSDESPHVSNKFFTGYEVTDSYEYLLSAEMVEINNTDWYLIGGHRDGDHFRRAAVNDERFIIVLDLVFVTGLALKELINDGFKSHGSWRLATVWEFERIKNAVIGNDTVMSLTPAKEVISKQEVARRIEAEIERAKSGEVVRFNAVKGYTEDGKEIRMAWFASKPCSIEEVKRKHYASFEKYTIVKTFEVDAETFDKFEKTLDLGLLGEVFEGGTIDEENGNIYRVCAEIVCSEREEVILIDPQGYDYPRYMAIVERGEAESEPTKKDSAKGDNVIEFATVKAEKDKTQDFNKQIDHFVKDILPKLNIDDLIKLKESGEDMGNELMRIMMKKDLEKLKR